jgi:NADH-quinone oxidoreductase subunit M
MIQLDQPVLLSAVVAPTLASLLLPIIGRKVNPRNLAIISGLMLLYPLIVITVFTLIPGLGIGVVDPAYFQNSYLGSFSMLLDGLSGPIAFSITLVTMLVAAFAFPYMTHRFEEMEKEGASKPSWGSFYMLYILFATAMLGTALSTNLIEFYIFLELTLVPSFLLIAFYGYGARERIALMYLIWTHVGALLFLIGAIAIGFSAGSFDILNMQNLQFWFGRGENVLGNAAIYVAIVILIGLFIKMAVFGVHIWLPYAHAEAPTPVSALLSPNLIGIGGYAIVRVVYIMFPTILGDLSIYLIVLALVTMIYGGLMSLAQDDFKRMLAYSSISQMGYLLLGIASLNSLGVSGAMLHYATHAIGKAILFSVAGVIIVQLHGLRSISKMGGLASKMPITAALALLGFMQITGIPPSLGLWSEVLIVFGAVSKAYAFGAVAFALLVVGLLVAIGLSTAYSFITIKRIFFGHLSPEVHQEGSLEGGRSLLFPILIIAIIGVLLFFFASIFINPLIDFAKSQLHLLG